MSNELPSLSEYNNIVATMAKVIPAAAYKPFLQYQDGTAFEPNEKERLLIK